MTLLFLKIAASGLMLDRLPEDSDQQPWICRIAYFHCMADGTVMNRAEHYVKPDGRKIHADAKAKHGIDEAMCSRNGIPEPHVLGLLTDMVAMTQRVIHFGDFDKRLVTSLLLRYEAKLGKQTGRLVSKWLKAGVEFIDLQHPACQLACKIDVGREDGEFKWPSLDEAGVTILGEEPREGLHDAWDDLVRTKRLYFELMRLGHFEEVAA